MVETGRRDRLSPPAGNTVCKGRMAPTEAVRCWKDRTLSEHAGHHLPTAPDPPGGGVEERKNAALTAPTWPVWHHEKGGLSKILEGRRGQVKPIYLPPKDTAASGISGT